MENKPGVNITINLFSNNKFGNGGNTLLFAVIVLVGVFLLVAPLLGLTRTVESFALFISILIEARRQLFIYLLVTRGEYSEPGLFQVLHLWPAIKKVSQPPFENSLPRLL